MTISELGGRVTDRLHLTKRQTEAVVSILLTCITEALREGDKVELRGFGSFRARSRNAREGRNPRTGDAVRVASKRVPFFKARKALREKVGSVDPINNLSQSVRFCLGLSGGVSRVDTMPLVRSWGICTWSAFWFLGVLPGWAS